MTVHEECVDKLNPNGLHCSEFFTAVLGCLLSENWTSPKVTGIEVNDKGMRHLKANINRVAQKVDLSNEAWDYLLSLIPVK